MIVVKHSQLKNVTITRRGAIGAERASIRDGRDVEYWPNVDVKHGRTHYATMNSKFYALRKEGYDVSMVTCYAPCDDASYLARLVDSAKVISNGATLVKIIMDRKVYNARLAHGGSDLVPSDTHDTHDALIDAIKASTPSA